MDLEGSGGDLIRVLLWHFLGGTEEKHQRSKSGLTLSWPSLELKMHTNVSDKYTASIFRVEV
jgi:hypothetical protein